MSRLVVVSNRVSRASGGASQTGGLAVGLLGALRDTRGLWFGWSGKVSEDPSPVPATATHGGISYAVTDLAQRDYEEYYNGYSNSTLWPMFHYRLDLARFQRDDYRGYRRVNARFATALKGLIEPDDLIWVHDYHLIPLGEELRKLGVRNRMGFFLHTPFPAHQVLAVLPNHREIVAAMCAYDVVGLQSARDLRSFTQYLEFELRREFPESGVMRAFRHDFFLAKFPIGIDAENVAGMAEAPSNAKQAQRLRQSLRGRNLIIGVDRLDYSKGLVQRFHAFEHLLTLFPERCNKVVFMQIAPPSREDVTQYTEIRHELETEAGRINGRFAEFDWVPIRYLNRSFRRDAVASLFRGAQVGLVTPLRDGMNLVAKEYVASQDPKDPGVLVLSCFAGASEQLTSALIVNPFDEEQVAIAIVRALDMPLQERRARWRSAMSVVQRYDISAWQRNFLRVLRRAPFSK